MCVDNELSKLSYYKPTKNGPFGAPSHPWRFVAVLGCGTRSLRLPAPVPHGISRVHIWEDEFVVLCMLLYSQPRSLTEACSCVSGLLLKVERRCRVVYR